MFGGSLRDAAAAATKQTWKNKDKLLENLIGNNKNDDQSNVAYEISFVAASFSQEHLSFFWELTVL